MKSNNNSAIREWITQYKTMNREFNHLISNFQLSFKSNEQMTRTWRDLGCSTDEATTSIKNKLLSFKSQLQTVSAYINDTSLATNPQHKNKLSAEELQRKLESFETRLSQFKSRMREDFDSFSLQETKLQQELKKYEAEFESWQSESKLNNNIDSGRGKAKEDQIRKKRTEERYQLTLDRQARIGAIDRKIIALGGRTGGWDSRDHDVFLRIWTQTVSPDQLPDAPRSTSTSPTNNGASAGAAKKAGWSEKNVDGQCELPQQTQAQLLRKLLPLLPGMDEGGVLEHIFWHTRVLRLQAQKKALLDTWRRDRSRARDLAAAGADDESSGLGLGQSPSTRPGSAPAGGRAHRNKDPIDIKEHVARWKQQRASEEERKKMELKRREDEERLLEVEAFRRRQQAARMRVQQWRERQSAGNEREDSSTQSQRPSKRSTSVDRAELQRRAERNKEIAEQKRRLREEHEHQENAREEKFKRMHQKHVEKVSLQPREPARVWAPTAASKAQQLTPEQLDEIEHRRLTGGAHSAAVPLGGYDLKFGGRAVPSWVSAVTR